MTALNHFLSCGCQSGEAGLEGTLGSKQRFMNRGQGRLQLCVSAAGTEIHGWTLGPERISREQREVLGRLDWKFSEVFFPW